MSNWQRKSEYLLREIVKFKTYVDCLHAAAKAKEDVTAIRAEREALKQSFKTPPAAKPQPQPQPKEEDDDDEDDELLGRGNRRQTAMEFLMEAEQSRNVTPRASQVPTSSV